jgi:hypothetical protein
MPGFSLFGNSGDKINETISNTYNATDSYNETYSSSSALNNVGNVYLGDSAAGTAGVTGQAPSLVANLGPYLVPAALVFGALYFLQRAK